MKKIFLLLLSSFLLSQHSWSQHSAGANDIARALRGGRVSLHSSKSLLEYSEQAVLDLQLLVTPVVNEQTLETQGVAYPIPLPDGSDPNIPAAYHSSNWRVVQGGGTISSIQGNQCVYTAPATSPADKTMVISVDLDPTSNVLPKIVLLITLYFVDDQTAIVVNVPQGGFNNEKFVSQASAGVQVPTMQGMDPRVAARVDPGLQAKMAQAQQAMNAAQQSSGINLAAITSNSMAYFDQTTGVTAVKFTQLAIQMENGRDVRTSTTPSAALGYICEVSFKGKGKGMYPLSDMASGIIIKQGIKGCFCGNNRNNDTKPAPCNGFINIKSDEKGVMKGEFAALVYSEVENTLVQGYIYGRFTVKNANAQ